MSISQRSLLLLDGARCRIITGLIFRHIHQNLDRDKRSNKKATCEGPFFDE